MAVRFHAPVFALLLLCAFALAPLGYPGYFQPYTGFAPIYALYSWEESGWSLLWVSPDSTHTPLRGDGILPYALAGFLRLFGLTGEAAVKSVFALALLVGASGTFRLFRRRLTVPIALGLAAVWVYSPMSLSALYVRGSPGASLGLGLLPWLALALLHQPADSEGRPPPFLAHTCSVGAVPAVVVGLTAGLSHYGFALLALAVLALLAALSGERRLSPWPAVGLLLATVHVGLLAARQSFLPQTAPVLQFALPYQLLSSQAGHGFSSYPWAAQTPAPLSLGVLPVVLLVGSMALGGSRSRTSHWLPGLLLSLALMALASSLAVPVWGERGLSLLLDGPWQLLALSSFLLLWLAVRCFSRRLAAFPSAGAALAILSVVVAMPLLDVPLTAVRPASAPMAAFGEGSVLLVRAELHGPLRHGATPRLRLFWQATRPLDQDYTVFVHVLDGQDRKWGQRDSQPADGAAPTSSWRPGELVVDEHPIYVDVNGPRQGYRLLLGLYRQDTGERLSLVNGTTALELGGE